MATHDPYGAAVEFREQLTSEKRKIAFLFGAGTSMAVGLPGIDKLTKDVLERLDGDAKDQFEAIGKELHGTPNIEQILGRLRTYRQLMCDGSSCSYVGMKDAGVAKDLDKQVCQGISACVRKVEAGQQDPHFVFAKWVRALYANRDWPVEIFTTNYDLLIETALERLGVPYFDGFVGSVRPFFAPESVEADPGGSGGCVYPPRGWSRLCKLHGSVNWSVHSLHGVETIHRFTGSGDGAEELMIYPSHDKYIESRKQPFITFQDHLRRFLTGGECLLVVSGFSFSDQHLNDIILQGLRANPRLAVTVLAYGDWDEETESNRLPDRLSQHGVQFTNLTLYGPDKACIGGVLGDWSEPRQQREAGQTWPFWNPDAKTFTLGDFNKFADFLEEFIRFDPPLKADRQAATPASTLHSNDMEVIAE